MLSSPAFFYSPLPHVIKILEFQGSHRKLSLYLGQLNLKYD
ncbi:hypothetical protein Cabys_529 [Caldithrix abyssi DSM 13497]|uniref:Uncharacterized protein n=1 Tax=Caldithrix abyssi DSM 13497 TaxID=880073 RepID=A0A1J1C5W4_CALAY|nr:hypothetical protein Cabys_529 [Caldithrix abyssi DSM 13497]